MRCWAGPSVTLFSVSVSLVFTPHTQPQEREGKIAPPPRICQSVVVVVALAVESPNPWLSPMFAKRFIQKALHHQVPPSLSPSLLSCLIELGVVFGWVKLVQIWEEGVDAYSRVIGGCFQRCDATRCGRDPLALFSCCRREEELATCLKWTRRSPFTTESRTPRQSSRLIPCSGSSPSEHCEFSKLVLYLHTPL